MKESRTQYFNAPNHSLLIVIANIQEDSRERILLTKNRIGDTRSLFVRENEHLLKERRIQQKNILFLIRTVEK